MKIGIPKEIISQEYRVSINPETAKMLLQSSHELYVQSGAGIVADSNPRNEYVETVNKAKALLKAIN